MIENSQVEQNWTNTDMCSDLKFLLLKWELLQFSDWVQKHILDDAGDYGEIKKHL